MDKDRGRKRSLQSEVEFRLKMASNLLWDYMEDSTVQGLNYIRSVPVGTFYLVGLWVFIVRSQGSSLALPKE